jgi:hypothetical protein
MIYSNPFVCFGHDNDISRDQPAKNYLNIACKLRLHLIRHVTTQFSISKLKEVSRCVLIEWNALLKVRHIE